MLLGYFLVFVTTPHDLTWHLTAFERLLVQLWPSLLLAVMLLTATPSWLQASPRRSQDDLHVSATRQAPGRG
jgi:hypothetical protein